MNLEVLTLKDWFCINLQSRIWWTKNHMELKRLVNNTWFDDLCNRYLALFKSGMMKSEKSDDLPTRIKILNNFFTYLLYCNVARSLFEKDKMLLSFLICATNMRGAAELDEVEWAFFLSGPSATHKTTKPNPSQWLSEKLWNEMVHLSTLPAFVVQDNLHPSEPFLVKNWTHRTRSHKSAKSNRLLFSFYDQIFGNQLRSQQVHICRI